MTTDTCAPDSLTRARDISCTVTDPEMPMLTLVDLGVLRDVRQDLDGTIIVTITPTYSGCPAMATMRADLERALAAAGYDRVEVRTSLAPAWSSDWITDDGRRKLKQHGIAPAHVVRAQSSGPIPLTLVRHRPMVQCPQCDSFDTEETSEFGSTACKSLHRCRCCGEPFDRIKEL
ncbi:1,2-phenylacetyl-CoA epoxidase subunit PaaD [Mycolicibacterium alvei]|uniref:Putative phenylacetic acid degradation protein PaaD/phenylacetate-CoA oxygenase, PaaJ subunit n=1 Tax=Mycolicibacterium alvei TaxID=67081 RepID=A0A6N4URK3_9MYCO|nr:1,2-phenylacetyl-CoA epoxidase subunit PaaD [Mycolicibacterium alvei]MCV7003908.1 phenylacetate-CoA oxygenase subunit PaaJ [Mycolicibacterium alvei]BBX27666.1 putative phenylacetic acid degradation protein PaaD/phenylacetate-CoA oxygenase, PaaJ subunit [Mycolicibacterium alvei]